MAALISPQPLAVGEVNQNQTETDPIHNSKQSYADLLKQKQSTQASSKIELCPVIFDHGEPIIQFTMEEVNNFIREEGLHQAVVVKFSYGKPDLQEVRKIISSQFDIQGHCKVGQLEFRHLLIRFDLYNDYVHFLSKSTGYLKSKGDEYFFRTFPWTLGFNPKEETSMSVVWISLPGLPPNFFAKRSLMSIASAVGKALAVDKATQDRTRPSAARVKVIIDLLDKHPKKVKLQIVDRVSGKSIEFYQEIVYDNLPKYCTYCKHQGHDEKACRVMKEQAEKEVMIEELEAGRNLPIMEETNFEKLQGDARDYLNAKRVSRKGIELITRDAGNGQQQVVQKLHNETNILNAGHDCTRLMPNVVGIEPTGGISRTDALDSTVKCHNVVDGNRAVIVPDAVNATDKKVSTEAGQSSGCSARVPVKAGIEIVVQDVVNAKNNRGSYVEAKVSDIEPGQHQLMMGDSTLNATVRAKVSKHNTAVADFDVLEKVAKLTGPIGSQLEANNALNTIGSIPKGGTVNTSIAQEVQDEEQQLEDVGASRKTVATAVRNTSSAHATKELVERLVKNAGDHAELCATEHDELTGRLVKITDGTKLHEQQNLKVNTVENENLIGKATQCKNDTPTGVSILDDRGTTDVTNLKATIVLKGAVDQPDAVLVDRALSGTEAGQISAKATTAVKPALDATDVTQVVMHQQTSNVQTGVCVTRKDSATPRKNVAATGGSNLKATVAMTSDSESQKALKNNARVEKNNGKLTVDDQGIDMSKNKEEWNLVTNRNFPTKKQVPPKLQNNNGRRFECNVDSSINSFGLLSTDGDLEVEATGLNDSGMQLVTTDSNDRQQEPNKNNVEKLVGKAHSSNIPTLHFSSPTVEQIIKEAEIAMMTHTNLVKQPMVLLNTSVQEIPSQSLESYGEFEGASGQHLMSTGNNNVIANVRDIVVNAKLWKDQREYDDEESWGDGFAGYESEEDEQEFEQDSAGEDIEVSATSKRKSAATSMSNLNSNALAFIPRKSPTTAKPSATTGNMPQGATIFSPTGQLNEDDAGQHQLVTTAPLISLEERQLLDAMQHIGTSTTCAISMAKSTGQQQDIDINPAAINVAAVSNPGQQQLINLVVIDGEDRKATTPKSGQQQKCANTSVFALEDRLLLDALVSTKPSINAAHKLSTGRMAMDRRNTQFVEQHQDKAVISQYANVLIAQDTIQNLPNPVNVGRDMYEDGEEDEMLQKCRQEAAKKGDLSPMHSGQSKKTHTRKKSWDGKVNEEANVRRLPMRVAKQKQAAPTTSTRSNRSKKKS